MASPWLKRSFILSESDCSGPNAKRRDLEIGANEERDPPAHSPNGEWLQPEMDLHSPQSGINAFPISPQANFQFAHSDLSQGIDATMLDSSVNILQPWNHKNCLSANPQRDAEAPVLSSQPEGEPDLQLSETCFGMICDVKAQFLDDPGTIESAGLLTLPSSNEDAYTLKLIRRDNHIALQHERDVDIAILNTKITNVLWAIEELGHVRYEVFVGVEIFSTSITTWANKGQAVNFPVEIIIYGNNQISEQIGRSLSDAEIYLQHPRCCSDHAKYDNPHYLEFKHSPKLDLPQQLCHSLTVPNKLGQSAPNFQLSALLNCLDQHENLGDGEIDCRIKTSLLRHQKTGVDFIGQREGWRVSSIPELWKIHQRDQVTFYEHIILGTRKSSVPPQIFGGILADEMGLGKTLTVLSAIVGSLGLAHSSTALSSYDSLPTIPSCKMSAKGTLIIAPSVLVLDEWLKEIQRHVAPDLLNVLTYHGQKRESEIRELLDFDILLTTYATVASEFGKGSGPLYRITWFRIVLDEAQSIRHQRTKQFRAITSLSASYRWCLTGTPIQNTLFDLGALIRFLRVPLLENASNFRDHIVSPIESGKMGGFNNLRTLLKSICLRRTRDLLHFPEPEEVIYELELSPVEKEMYDSISESSKQAIDDVVSGRKTMEAYNGILQAIMQLRLLCNHGNFGHMVQKSGLMGSLDLDETLASLQQTDDAICATCSCDVTSVNNPEVPNSGRFTTCSHLLCDGCFFQYEQDLKMNRNGEKIYCPICSELITVADGALSPATRDRSQSYMINPNLINIGHATKLSKLLEDICEVRHSAKSIIFTSWKKTLHIIGALLAANKIPFVQIDGSLTLPERRRILTSFQENSDLPVLLMTLGTGAVGLNITAASRIHIVEPQWNPAVESQAIGRSARLGQQNHVKIVRYIMKNTIEEYVRSRQFRKLKLAGIGWGSGKEQEEQKLSDLLKGFAFSTINRQIEKDIA